MLHLLKKRAKPFVRQCNFYLSREGETAIVVSTYNHGGLFAEKQNGAILCKLSEAAALGQLIMQKLAECECKEEFNYANAKRSDWPAYNISGYKTIKSFEQAFVRYGICGANDANTAWRLTSPALQDGIELHSEISAIANDAEIGICAIRMHSLFLRTETTAHQGR